jgi:hypothetical protein
MDPTNDPYGTGTDNGSLSSSLDGPSFNLAGYDNATGSGTANSADPNALGSNQAYPGGPSNVGPNFYSGATGSWTGTQPSPANGWSGSSGPGTNTSGLLSGLLNWFAGGPATPATPATPGALGSLGLTSNGKLTQTGMIALVAGAAVLALVLLKR